jgi:ankyrin repeat protein
MTATRVKGSGMRLRMSAVGALLAPMLLWASAPPESPVADAAERGDIAAVRTLLEKGADVNAARGDGMSALHWAAERGDLPLAELLLEADAEVDAVTRLGHYTPLHIASMRGHAAVVGRLLDAGADVALTTTTGGATALHLAAGSASAEAVRLLLEHGAEVDAREHSWGQTPLMFAASAGRRDVVRALLEGGADPSLTTLVMDVAATEAVDEMAGEVRDSVLASFQGESGAEGGAWRPTPDQTQAAVHEAQKVQRARPTKGETLPADAEGEGGGGFSALVGAQGGLTALLHAAREGHTEVALALLDAGADVNQVSVGDHSSPILMATINGYFDLALELLERGADPNITSHAGAGPLFAAINTQWAPKARYPQQQAYQQQEASYLDLMRALLEAGADPNARLTEHLWYMSYTFDLLDVDVTGATPFWRAAYATDVEAMKLMVANGADPNIPTRKPAERRRGGGGGGEQADPSGLPPVPEGGPAVWPIHAASGVGYGEGYAGNSHRHVTDGWLPSVKYLVEEIGVDVNARDHNGYNAVHHAAARGDNELILYLVEHGADVTAVSRQGQTTADMANGPQQRISPFPETIRLLESLGSKNNHNCRSC